MTIFKSLVPTVFLFLSASALSNPPQSEPSKAPYILKDRIAYFIGVNSIDTLKSILPEFRLDEFKKNCKAAAHMKMIYDSADLVNEENSEKNTSSATAFCLILKETYKDLYLDDLLKGVEDAYLRKKLLLTDEEMRETDKQLNQIEMEMAKHSKR